MPNEDGQHTPRKGDKIWSQDRAKADKQPNGFIYEIIEYGSDGIVMIQWYGNEQDGSDIEHEDMSVPELDDKYHGHVFGYMLYSDGREVSRKN